MECYHTKTAGAVSLAEILDGLSKYHRAVDEGISLALQAHSPLNQVHLIQESNYINKSSKGSKVNEEIDGILSSWKLSRHPVPKDGNCFFTAIAIGLLNSSETDLAISSAKIGIDLSVATFPDIIKALIKVPTGKRMAGNKQTRLQRFS
eukprot:m.271771 g.271771  ORF g.271771 m.271771 type:complete len:149 (+) comp40554_c0_seq4:1065-1511(+)